MGEKRICPDCGEVLPVGTGTYFDSKHNVICVFCDGIVFAAASPAERKTEKKATTSHYGHKNPNRGIDSQGTEYSSYGSESD